MPGGGENPHSDSDWCVLVFCRLYALTFHLASFSVEHLETEVDFVVLSGFSMWPYNKSVIDISDSQFWLMC